MATLGETGAEKGIDGIGCHLRTGQTLAQAQHIGVVVLATQSGPGYIGHGCGPNSANLVGGDGNADTTATDGDPQFGSTLGHGPTYGRPEIRVVDRRRALGANVVHVMTGGPEVISHLLLQLESTMI